MTIRLSQQDVHCIHSVKALLDKEYKCRFTIRELESKFRINENKLRHGFKLLFRLSIFDYHNHKKLQQATFLLEEDRDRTIQEVAYRSGFKDISTFNRAFKRAFKITPREWRKRIQP